MTLRRELGLLILAVLLLLARVQARAASMPEAPESVPGEVVVQFKPQSRASMSLSTFTTRINKRLAGFSIKPKSNVLSEVQAFVVSQPEKIQAAIEAIKTRPEVRRVEPNYIYRTTRDPGLPTDPDLNLQWGIRNTGQLDTPKKSNGQPGQEGTPGSDVDVLRIWRQGWTGNRRVVVAVIDTGVDYTHPDLADNIYINRGEIPDNRIDDDKNGFIDDVRGWDFQNDDNDPMDDNRHGTHCAGVIGARGNNSLGITGINHQVSILPVKFLGNNGGTLEGAVKSINYATQMKVHIMSNSWGGGGESEIMKEAIEKARDAGILFVAAAGNSNANNDSANFFPSNYDVSNVLAVAALDNQDKVAKFSNYGKRKVHVGAPGVEVYSTVIDGMYERLSGTSMACPHVSGVAALMRSRKIYANAEELKTRILKTAVKLPHLRSKVSSSGRLNAYNAIFGLIQPDTEPKESDWVSVPVSVESLHPYGALENTTFKLEAPVPAKFVRVHFAQLSTEANFDFVTLSDAKGVEGFRISGEAKDIWSDYLDGSDIQVTLTSDPSVQGWGFRIDQLQYVPR